MPSNSLILRLYKRQYKYLCITINGLKKGIYSFTAYFSAVLGFDVGYYHVDIPEVRRRTF